MWVVVGDSLLDLCQRLNVTRGFPSSAFGSSLGADAVGFSLLGNLVVRLP